MRCGHTAVALKKAQLPEALVDEIRSQAELSDPKLDAVASFTREVIATRGAVSDKAFAAFKAARYTDASALEVILGVSLATLCNFANNLGPQRVESAARGLSLGTEGADRMNSLAAWLRRMPKRSTAIHRAPPRCCRDWCARAQPRRRAGNAGRCGRQHCGCHGFVAAVAQRSLTAAFVLWGHRTFIEYLQHSDNGVLRERTLAPLLKGEIAGATGLSNAMKFLSNIEDLQMHATRHAEGFTLDGSLPWMTNLRREGFIAAAAFEHEDGTPPSSSPFHTMHPACNAATISI